MFVIPGCAIWRRPEAIPPVSKLNAELWFESMDSGLAQERTPE